MTIKCAKCGEQLLGAVNRCWRCGTPLESRPGDAELPPVRRAPLVETLPAVDAASGETQEDEPVYVAEEVESQGPRQLVSSPSGATAVVAKEASMPVVARRVGSPFSESATPPAVASGQPPSPIYYPVRPADYPRHSNASAGAVAALVLGVMSLIASFFTAFAVLTAIIGLLVGIWGLYSTRRGPAMAGILLCCIGLLMGGFRGVVAWHEFRYGYAPWEASSNAIQDDDSVEDGGEDAIDDF